MNSVKIWREKNGWTQETLAELTGLSTRTIHRVERGERVGLETWAALAAVFQVSIATLQQPPIENEVRSMITPEIKIALKKVRQIRDFYIQLSIYFVINLLLFLINLIMTPDYWWVIWVVIGWGIGILIKAFRIWVIPIWLDDEWERKKVEQQLNKRL
ncbi:helix-turn-helix domain-containing protein [Gallibacterium salpingitidis]|uniref:HTH cro/C1-type domain-containing protein n=1 Tax=Gallibacterium salpingitidis TaxID=505341 RepID=A0A1A7P1C2_9PAST|nr:helix-turn-helix domain-containing protein [Gallibacterium salpingitidis]OBW96242.1 hypothetical protein QS62_01225 [Gallibacterium salpingitidis]